MEQKKAKKVYARFGTQARRDWKRAGRKTVRSHYWPSVLLCLVAAFLGTEFTGSLDVLHLTQQKWDTISNFLASFGRPGRGGEQPRRVRTGGEQNRRRFASGYCEQHRHVAGGFERMGADDCHCGEQFGFGDILGG